MEHINIAIDGPAGAGKSTIAKLIAKRMDILHLDTGAMYRAMALKALRNGISPLDAAGVENMLATTDLVVSYENGTQRVKLDGEDVTECIRTPEISKGASDIGTIPAMRLKMVELQQKIAACNDVIMDGRDIGSYVLPNSKNKFYLTASVDERAKRRYLELKGKPGNVDKTLEQVKAEIIARDHTDSTREFAPLTCVEDAHFIDTTDMSIESVVETVVSKIEK